MDRLIRSDQDPDQKTTGSLIRLKKGEEKPPNARLLSEEEVLGMQQRTIMTWKPRYEMWPFTWGLGFLGGTSALTGMIINNYCRRQLGLMSLARLSTYLPTVGLPIFTCTVFHNYVITKSILVGDYPCTVCAAIRSGAIQCAAGALYPMILGPLVCIISARRNHTYYVPSIQETGKYLPFLQRLMPKPGILLILAFLNFGVGMILSEKESLLFTKYLCPTSESLRKDEYLYANADE